MKFLLSTLLAVSAAAAAPRDVVPLDAAEVPMNFRLHIEFSPLGAGLCGAFVERTPHRGVAAELADGAGDVR